MKEKGINKIIELLNEYEKRKGEKYGRGNYVWGIDKENKNIFASRFPDLAYICEEESKAIIICKGYEFIKWLVDNDKIDIKALVVKGEMRSGWDFDNKKGNEESGEEIWNKYYSELCLMLLSIQDNPIEFLVSILK